MDNNYSGLKIEFHILQSFPVTCLNRDDVGAPKTAMIGGVNRARVSSQCWKRQVRLALHDLGIKTALRTKRLVEKLNESCKKYNEDDEAVNNACEAVAKVLSKDTLHFICQNEIDALAEYIHESELKPVEKEIKKVHKKAFNPAVDGLDIALFGRMVAQAAELTVEGASSFSHAISTHKVSNEIDYFTALDDVSISDEDLGSAHIGSLEYNSATYYRYINLDIGQLVENFGNEDKDIIDAVTAFIKAIFIAVPEARQKTQAGYSPWNYAKVYLRKGQAIQANFEKPIYSKGEGYLKPSIDYLQNYLGKIEKMCGSLFMKQNEFQWGIDENYSIDNLISDITDSLRVYNE